MTNAQTEEMLRLLRVIADNSAKGKGGSVVGNWPIYEPPQPLYEPPQPPPAQSPQDVNIRPSVGLSPSLKAAIDSQATWPLVKDGVPRDTWRVSVERSARPWWRVFLLRCQVAVAFWRWPRKSFITTLEIER